MDFHKYLFRMNIRSKISGIFAILIVVSFLFYNFSIMTLRNEQKKLKMNLASNKKVLEARIENVKRIGSLEAELNRLRKESKDIEKIFLAEEALSSFFIAFRNLASGNNVEILRLNIKEKEPQELAVADATYKYEKVPVDISLKGTYFDTVIFLSGFRKNQVLLSVSELNMSAENKGSKNEFVKTDFRLILYLASK